MMMNRFATIFGIFFLMGIAGVGYGQEMLKDTAYASKLLRDGKALFPQRKFDEIFAKLDSAGQIYLTTFGEMCEGFGSVLHGKAMIFQNQNKIDTAIILYKKAIEVRSFVLGEAHIDVANSYNNLGNMYARIAKNDQAIEYLQKSLSIRSIVIKAEDAGIADLYNNLVAPEIRSTHY